MSLTPSPAALAGSASESGSCFHCAEPVTEPGRWHVHFDGRSHDVCCVGCEAIGNTIVAAGLDDYYRFRTEPVVRGLVPDALAAQLDEYAAFDAPEIAERYVSKVGTSSDDSETLREIGLSVEGLRCGACVWLLERSLLTVPGIDSAQVNLATERARVRFDASSLSLSSLLKQGARYGFRLLPYDAAAQEAKETQRVRQMRQRLFVAGLGMMQVMMYALPGYLDPSGEIEQRFVQLLRWASLVLTTPVILYSAVPFLSGAWRDIKNRSPGMDVPVAIGLLVAFSASVVNTLRGSGEVWFDSVSMFVFLLLAARGLEYAARRKAGRALESLVNAVPVMATRLSGEERETVERVPAAQLVPGDLIEVASGERAPVDACACRSGAVDLSLLTGESTPVRVCTGDSVPGGALVTDTPLLMNVERPLAQSTVSLLGALVERGSAERPALAHLADKVARVFVTTVVIASALVFAVWWHIDASRAPEIAIAVLIVSCPCALSLATPAALAAATGRLLSQRVLITRGTTLEAAARVTDVVFDKTGTLTTGKPLLARLTVASGIDARTALTVAGELERGAAHPHARAILEACATPELPAVDEVLETVAAGVQDAALSDLEHVPGCGVLAQQEGLRDSDGVRLRLGSARWCGASDSDIARFRGVAGDDGSGGEVMLCRERLTDGSIELLARFSLLDPLRPEAAATVRQLEASGRRVHLLSGDRQSVVDSVATTLGLAQVQGAASPEDKQARVVELQGRGACVLMVGDGLNDAPVMAAADVSLAVGRASDLAASAADAVSLVDGLGAVSRLVRGAERARRVIRENLTWALGYNALMLPLTATGFVPAWAAALGMASSSLVVSLNALRLLRPEHVTPTVAVGKWTRSFY